MEEEGAIKALLLNVLFGLVCKRTVGNRFTLDTCSNNC